MKKLLSLIGTIALIGTITTNVMSCNICNNINLENQEKINEKNILSTIERKINKTFVKNNNYISQNISNQINKDKNENKKSFSENALPFENLSELARKTFFWVNDEQIVNSKNIPQEWWNHKQPKVINYTEEQTNKVKEALENCKKELENISWFNQGNNKFNWEYFKNNYGKLLEIDYFTDGDTVKINNLKNQKLSFSKNEKIINTDNVRLLVLDTDETFWSRYNISKKETNKPTRLGYVQKTVSKIAEKIYENQKWLIIPVDIDKYNRILGFLFTPDGIPWHKFMCDYYMASIYNDEENIKKIFNESWMGYEFKSQWWMINYWKSRASNVPDNIHSY